MKNKTPKIECTEVPLDKLKDRYRDHAVKVINEINKNNTQIDTRVQEERVDDMCRYKNERGLSCKEIKNLSASQIIWHINYLASDKRDHPLWEDCARYLEFKMKEIKKLVSYLEREKPPELKE